MERRRSTSKTILYTISFFFFISLFPLFNTKYDHQHKTAIAQPVYSNSRWIVNESGRRVKLACVNWVSHLDVVVAEGLSKQPVDVISKNILDLGFNCVRLTWPLFLFTNQTLASISVRESFQMLGLIESIAGIQANNPSIIDLTLIDAYKEVVGSISKSNLMIILDNHISKPGWCCSNIDGNGFFGDEYFNPSLWIQGLTNVATFFKGFDNVIGMSLRNELRGPKQNVYDWYRYIQQGAEAVHAANPDVLVILSGLNYDKDLSFLEKKAVSLTFKNKLVFELHWYAFSDGQAWANGNANQVCGEVMSNTMRRAGFLLNQGYPLFISEFGVDLRGTNENDNRFLNCFLGFAAQLDLDWALWTLVGSYYYREGIAGHNEVYGILEWNWCQLRNSTLLQRLNVLQSPLKGPGYTETRPHQIIFHPATGLCIIRKSYYKPLELGPCNEAEAWSYTPQHTLKIKGTYYCLQTDKLGQPVKLGITCNDINSKWEAISDSKMHLSSELCDGGGNVCLDVDSNNLVVTNTCKCMSKDNSCDPGSQWFKIIETTRTRNGLKSLNRIQNTIINFVTDALW